MATHTDQYELSILLCPRCNAVALKKAAGKNKSSGPLTCLQCAASYPVVDGIPQLSRQHPLLSTKIV